VSSKAQFPVENIGFKS